MENTHGTLFSVVAGLLLMFMAILAGGAAWRESVTIDEVAHIGAGVSYFQKLDLRLNEEPPPLPKVLAALPLVLRGTHADYSHISWTVSEKFFPAYVGQWVFGEWLLTKWNNPLTTLAWARLPMLLLMLVLGWVLYAYARRLGGNWGGLLCLSIYVSTPAFLTFGPLVHTDLAVTLFYFIFSLNQSSDVLYRLGHGSAAVPLRRLLMPPWLYLRGVLWVLITGSRPTFILGHAYPHGVWFYFPVLFALKSSLGFLGLLALPLALALRQKRRDEGNTPVIPAELTIHWRVLWVSLVVFTGFCLLSRLDISIRHFSIPLVLLILLLAALPRMVERLRLSAPTAGRLVGAMAGVLTLSCLFTAVRAYPYYFPYINAFSLGHPAYALVNDSNLDWNQSLPEVKRFADQRGLQSIDLDEYGFNDPTVTVPQSEFWDCQRPTAADDGQWAVVSANMILDGHNCVWLMQYSHQPLAGGSMYAVHLPEHIPPAGSLGGPPLPSAFREFGGAPFDMRVFFLDLIHHPEKLPQAIEEMQARFSSSNKPETHPSPPSNVN